MEKVIGIFEINELKKSFFLFNHNLEVVSLQEQYFPNHKDENGFDCEDISTIKNWIINQVEEVVSNSQFDLVAINFTTSEASMVFLDNDGKLLAPIYSNLWTMVPDVADELYQNYGGKDEFCERTASSSTGMVNSGFQILWLKKEKKDIYDQVAYALHYPQYLSYIFTKSIVSECTSIGCHTGLWDFPNKAYHPWLTNEGMILTNPMCNDYTINIKVAGKELKSGIGIFDRAASLLPFSKSDIKKQILVSTGNWCVNMNPDNQEPLTREELNNGCFLMYGANKAPLKANRWAMGKIFEVNVKMLAAYFKADYHKDVEVNQELLTSFYEKGFDRVFFRDGVTDNPIDNSVDLSNFSTFEEAYHRLVYDLAQIEAEKIDQIIPSGDSSTNIIIEGKFATNELFVNALAGCLSDHKVYRSGLMHPRAIGAALAIWSTFDQSSKPTIELNLTECPSFHDMIYN